MKKLLVLLLLPLFSFSQTYDDIIGIESEEMFVRTMIENGFERMESSENVILYAYSPYYEDDVPMSTIWVHHGSQSQITDDVGLVLFQNGTRDFFGSEENSFYTQIFNTVKEKCDYVGLQPNPNIEGSQMTVYQCGAQKTFAFDKKDGTGWIEYVYNLLIR